MDEEDIFISDKFDDCSACRYRFDEEICLDCDYGEQFEEEDPEEVDVHFRGRI